MSDVSAPPVVPRGDGRFDLVDGARRRRAYAVHSASGTWVFFDGRVYVVGGSSPIRRPGGDRHVDDDTALSAPMPATVVAVAVAPGQQVKRGEALVTLEAMKMELVIRAPRDGTVARLACKAGDMVSPGVALLELE